MIRCFQSSSEVVLSDSGVNDSQNNAVDVLAARVSLEPDRTTWSAESPLSAKDSIKQIQDDVAAESMREEHQLGKGKRVLATTNAHDNDVAYSSEQPLSGNGNSAAREKKRARFDVPLSVSSH